MTENKNPGLAIVQKEIDEGETIAKLEVHPDWDGGWSEYANWDFTRPLELIVSNWSKDEVYLGQMHVGYIELTPAEATKVRDTINFYLENQK